jgi:prephenate dehydrogenase
VNPNFGTVTIVGVGLLGGSLGLALKARGLCRFVRGVGRRKVSLDAALAREAVDEVSLELTPAIEDADLIVVCTPAGLVPDTLDQIRRACSASAVITDVASTKAAICAHADRVWPERRRFIGSHPMAGSEKFGPEHAVVDLYEGCVTIVEPLEDQDPAAHETVRALWSSIGASIVELRPEQHDTLVARTSHIPHIMAALTAEQADCARGVPSVIGNGFRDTTRVAAGRPEVWRDICLTNREAIVTGLDSFAARLAAVREAIANGSGEEVEAFFETAREIREQVTGG